MLGHRLTGHRQVLAQAGRRPDCPRSAAGRASGAGSGRRRPTRDRRRPSRSSPCCTLTWPHPPSSRTPATAAGSGPSRLTCSAYSAATFASSQPRSRKPVSVSRSERAAVAAGSSSKRTRNELPVAADSPSSWVQRKENSRGGIASTTVNCTQVRSSSVSPNPIRRLPGTAGYSASSGHHSRRCSGLLTTSKTTSGEASMWISRSMVPNSVARFPCSTPYATFGCM